MSTRAWVVVFAIGALSCRRTNVSSLSVGPDPKASAAAKASAASKGVSLPPPIACTTDPRVRWASPPPSIDTLDQLASGEEAFACSPLKTGNSPLELTVAPGTWLKFPMDVEVLQSGADAGDASYAGPSGKVTYLSEGLPKGASADGSFDWFAAGAPGQTFAFSVAASVVLSEGPRCVKASMVVVVRDDTSTRKAQVQLLEAPSSVLNAVPREFIRDEATLQGVAARARCGDPMNDPTMKDVSGDGLADALFSFPPAPSGFGPSTRVYLRKGDDFEGIGDTIGSYARAPDGTSFMVTDYEGTIRIYRFNKDHFEDILLVAKQGPGMADPEEFVSGPRLEFEDGNFTGFSGEVGAPPKTRTWRWNGNRFAPKP